MDRPARRRTRAATLRVLVGVAAATTLGSCALDPPTEQVTATATPAASSTPSPVPDPASPRPTSTDGAAPTDSATPAAPGGDGTAVTGRYPADLGAEISGVAAGRAADGIWLVDDEPGTDRVHLVGLDGALRATVVLDATATTNPEDLAVGPCPDDAATSCVHVADIGDNVAARATVEVLSFPELVVDVDDPAGPEPTVEVAPRVRTLRYEDGPVDAEALVVTPDGAVVVVDKQQDEAGVHVAAAGEDVLRRVATLALPDPAVPLLTAAVGHTVTAAGLGPDGSSLVLRTYDQLLVLTAPDGSSLTADTAALLPSWTARDLGSVPTELQGEAADVLPDGRIVTVAEGATAISVTSFPGAG